MSTDPLSFLDEGASQAPAPEPAPEPQAAAPEPAPEAAPSGPQRDDKGRFAPKATADPAPAEPAPAPVSAAPEPAPAAQPLTVDELAEIKRQLEDLKRENQGLKSAVSAKRAEVRKAREPTPAPEYWTEEDQAYHGTEVEAVRLEAQQEAFDRVAQASFSRFSKANGEDLAKQVADWAGARSQFDKAFNDALIASDDPLETAYEAFQADPAQQIKALQAELAAIKGGASPNPAPSDPAPASPTPAPAPAPPRSIADAPSYGGAAHQPTGPGEAYRALPI